MIKKISFIIAVLIVLLLIPHGLYSYRKWNVLLVTLDTTRRDFLSCYNPKAAPTPNLDRIARQSVLFENAYSLIPITFPAHSSIFLSRPPHELNVFNNGDVLANQGPTLADLLRGKGYATGAFLSLGSLKKTFGLSQGFQTYEETFKHRWYSVASSVNQAALPWIAENAKKQKPFFAWIHYSDPHVPYITVDAPPDTEVTLNGISVATVCIAKNEKSDVELLLRPGQNLVLFRSLPGNTALATFMDPVWFQKKENVVWNYAEGWLEQRKKKDPENLAKYFVGQASLRLDNHDTQPLHVKMRFSGKLELPLDVVKQNYASEVQYMDRYIGQLWDKLSELGIQDNTILIITADHGEGLGERKRVGHLFPLLQQLTHIPFIVRYPHLGRSARSKALVCHLDIMPTILDLLHLERRAGMRGKSLKRMVSWSPVDFLFAERMQRPRIFSETYAPQGKSNSFAMVQDQWKLIETRQSNGWKWEMYDLEKDPGERNNLITKLSDPGSKEVLAMRGILQEYGDEAEKLHGRHKNSELDEDAKNTLRDLGYITQ